MTGDESLHAMLGARWPPLAVVLINAHHWSDRASFFSSSSACLYLGHSVVLRSSVSVIFRSESEPFATCITCSRDPRTISTVSSYPSIRRSNEHTDSKRWECGSNLLKRSLPFPQSTLYPMVQRTSLLQAHFWYGFSR